MSQIWILQSNLRAMKHDETRAVIEALQNLVLPWAAIPLLPFETDIREIPWDGPRVYFGSTNLVRNAAALANPRDPVFFDEAVFRPSVWGKRFGDAYLNSDARFTTVGELLGVIDFATEPFFVRPDADLKAFTGQVVEPDEVEKLFSEWSHGYSSFGKDLKIVIASPKQIDSETRTWIVDGEMEAAVTYRENGQRVVKPLDLDEHPELRQFARDLVRPWAPAKVFVLDVAQTPLGPKAIEVNAFHCSGLYHTSMALPVVRAVSNYVAAYHSGR